MPKLLPPKEAAARIRERDLAYLKRVGEPVLVLGREPMLSNLRAELSRAAVTVSETIELPGDAPTPRGILNQLTNGKDGLVAVAAPDYVQLIRHLVVLDRFRYAFVSFAMTATA